MSEPYIKQVRVQDFGCVKDATLELTRLHALIGPNDSGKTTLLRAVRTALQFASGKFVESPTGGTLHPFDPGVRPGGKTAIDLALSGGSNTPGTEYGIKQTGDELNIEEHILANGESAAADRKSWNSLGILYKSGLPLSVFPEHGLLAVQPRWLHLDADVMRVPSVLFQENEKKLLDTNGGRLPSAYDAILNRGDDTFLSIAKQIRELFPSIKNIRLKNIATNTKAFEIELVSGERVPASFVSDGVLYYLAFAALEHLSSASVLLIEEPENGLHPARIADVMRVLRRISERVQVILATHSPFVINELQGDEVTVVTRPDGQGTQVRRLCDTPNFEERSKLYALGELWVSYADGKNEEPLLAEVEGDS